MQKFIKMNYIFCTLMTILVIWCQIVNAEPRGGFKIGGSRIGSRIGGWFSSKPKSSSSSGGLKISHTPHIPTAPVLSSKINAPNYGWNIPSAPIGYHDFSSKIRPMTHVHQSSYSNSFNAHQTPIGWNIPNFPSKSKPLNNLQSSGIGRHNTRQHNIVSYPKHSLPPGGTYNATGVLPHGAIYYPSQSGIPTGYYSQQNSGPGFGTGFATGVITEHVLHPKHTVVYEHDNTPHSNFGGHYSGFHYRNYNNNNSNNKNTSNENEQKLEPSKDTNNNDTVVSTDTKMPNVLPSSIDDKLIQVNHSSSASSTELPSTLTSLLDTNLTESSTTITPPINRPIICVPIKIPTTNNITNVTTFIEQIACYPAPEVIENSETPEIPAEILPSKPTNERSSRLVFDDVSRAFEHKSEATANFSKNNYMCITVLAIIVTFKMHFQCSLFAWTLSL